MDVYQQALYFISGLAIFFLGQKILSQGLQTLGAKSVKNIVQNKNNTKSFHNFIDGARLTLLAFSPTMSFMVISGLANSRLLKAKRIVPMYIGTMLGMSTIVAILSFQTHQRGLNLIALGLIVGLVFHGTKHKILGKFFFGIGLAFLGISVMEESFKLLVLNDAVLQVLESLQQLNMFTSLVVFLICGLSLSIVLMSSTMVMAIVIVLSKLQVIHPIQTLAFVLGAALASYVMTLNSIRAFATAFTKQKMFVSINILITVLVISGLMFLLLDDVYTVRFSAIDVASLGLLLVSIFSYFVFLVFEGPLSSLSKSIYPEGDVKEQPTLKFLGEGRLLSPSMSYVLVEMEVAKLMDIVDRMFRKCEEYLKSNKKPARVLAKIKKYESIIDNIQLEIDTFLEKVISSGAGDEDSKMSLRYLQLSSLLEQVADNIDNFSTFLTKYYEQWELSADEKIELISHFDEVFKLYDRCYDIFTDKANFDVNSQSLVDRSIELKQTILDQRISFINEHEGDDPLKHLAFSDIVVTLAKLRGRVRDIYVTLHRK